jgi:hypothetical protein
MIVLSALSYLGVHSMAALFSAWQLKIARYGLIAAIGALGVFCLKAYWQAGLVEQAAIEAATTKAQEEARREAEAIQKQREASVEADARAETERAAKLEEARRASQPANSDPVVFTAGDGWLRGKSQAGSRSH